MPSPIYLPGGMREANRAERVLDLRLLKHIIHLYFKNEGGYIDVHSDCQVDRDG